MGRTRNLFYRRILNNLCTYSALKEGKNKSPLLKCGLHVVTSFQRVQGEDREITSHFTVEKPEKHSLNQVIKVNINSAKSH